MGFEPTPYQVHSLALCRLSYGHRLRFTRAWQESNLREGALQAPALPLGHMLGFDVVAARSARRAGIEPAASRFGAGHSSTVELPARPDVLDQSAWEDSNLQPRASE